jgi:hypothetical protein
MQKLCVSLAVGLAEVTCPPVNPPSVSTSWRLLNTGVAIGFPG